MQVKSMAEIQAEEHKREQMIKQKERERTEREISMVAIEQAKQEKARSAVKMQSWSTVITKNVPPSTPLIANSSVWGSANQTSMYTIIFYSYFVLLIGINKFLLHKWVFTFVKLDFCKYKNLLILHNSYIIFNLIS